MEEGGVLYAANGCTMQMIFLWQARVGEPREHAQVDARAASVDPVSSKCMRAHVQEKVPRCSDNPAYYALHGRPHVNARVIDRLFSHQPRLAINSKTGF